eukprot:357713-Chlamydomonas_euryale.AAC.1
MAQRKGIQTSALFIYSLCHTFSTRHSQVYPRNEHGGFWRVYQPNKWRLRKMKEAAEREAAAEADEAAAVAAAAAKARAIAGSSINLTSR